MQRLCQMVAWFICGDPMVWTLWSSEMILGIRVCFAYLRAIPSIQLVNVFFPRWRWYTLDIEWLYWGSEKGLSSSVFSRFGGGWFSLSVEIPLPAGQWFHTHPGPLWSHPALKWASSDWGHGWVWHLDPGQDWRVGCGSPDLERVRSSSWKWIPEFKSLV